MRREIDVKTAEPLRSACWAEAIRIARMHQVRFPAATVSVELKSMKAMLSSFEVMYHGTFTIIVEQP